MSETRGEIYAKIVQQLTKVLKKDGKKIVVFCADQPNGHYFCITWTLENGRAVYRLNGYTPIRGYYYKEKEFSIANPRSGLVARVLRIIHRER